MENASSVIRTFGPLRLSVFAMSVTMEISKEDVSFAPDPVSRTHIIAANVVYKKRM